MPAWMRLLLYFLYFKIASEILLDPGFGIFAAAIFAVIFEIAEFCCNLWVTVLTNPYDPVGQKFRQAKTVMTRTRLLMFILLIPLAILIAIGFAPNSIQFDSSYWFSRAIRYPGQWLLPFSVVMFIPLIIATVFPRKLKYDFPDDGFDK